METMTIRNPSLGGFSEALQEAILKGFRVSLAPLHYPHLDNQFNAVLERYEPAVEHVGGAPNAVINNITKKAAGRPPRTV